MMFGRELEKLRIYVCIKAHDPEQCTRLNFSHFSKLASDHSVQLSQNPGKQTPLRNNSNYIA